MTKTFISAAAFTVFATSLLLAQAVGGPEQGRPVKGDPGMTTQLVFDRPEYQVYRDWSEPGAVRRMHNHANTTYQVLTLVTGQLRLTVEGREPIDIKQGDVVEIPGSANHTFVNTGKVTATIVEVFGRAQKQ